MVYKYESPSQYRKTQSSIDKLNLEKVQLQEQLEKSQQDQGLLQRGLSLIGRPLSATSSAIAAATRPGGSPLEAFGQGLSGQSPVKSMADVLEQWGVPELGALETPFGRFTGRGVLGFGADVFADPLSLATLPLKGPSLLSRVARAPTMLRAAAPVAENVARAVPAAARPMPALGQTIEQAFQPSVARSAAQKLSQIPGVGPIIERVAGPAALAKSPLDKTLFGFEAQRSMIPNIVERSMAPLRGQAMPFKQVRDLGQGTEMFVESLNKWVPDGDLMHHLDTLNPAQRTWVETASKIRKPLLGQAQEVGVPFEKGLAPEALEDVFTSRRVTGQIGKDPITGKQFRRSIGGDKAVQLARKYPTQEAGMKAGLIYDELVHAQEMSLRELGETIAVKQLADEWQRLGIAARVPTEQLAQLKGVIGERAGQAKVLQQLTDVVQRARRGEAVPMATVRKFQEIAPEIADDLERALSVKIDSVATVLPRFAQEIQQILGVDVNRFKTALGSLARSFSLGKDLGRAKVGISTSGDLLIKPSELKRVLGMLGGENERSLGLLERIYTEAARYPTAQKADMLKTVLERAKEAYGGARGATAEAAGAYKAASQVAGEALEGLEGIPGSPAFKSLWFTPEEKDAIVKFFVSRFPPQTGITRTVNPAANLLRSVGATFDFSGNFIQNMVTMVTNPAQWGRMWATTFRAFADPSYHARMIERHAPLLSRYPNVVVSGSEYTAGMSQGLLGKIPFGAAKRFTAAFDAPGDAARISFLKGLDPLVQANPALKEAVESFANKATGTLSVQALGITPSQQLIEGTWLLFASRYVRASLALSTDIIRGGLRGDLARDALGHMLFGGLSFYNRVAQLAGLDDEEIARRLDPTNASFLTLDAGPMKIGVGGIWISMVKAIARISKDPSGVVEFSPDNPIFRFVSARLAPPTSIIRDLLAGETYVGQPLDNPVNLGLYANSRLLPFALSNALLSQTLGSRAGPGEALAEVGAGIGGLNVRPSTRRDMLEQVSREMFGQSYDSLDPIKQGQVQGNPRVQEVPLPQGKRFEQTRTEAEIWKQYREPLEEEAQRVLAKQSTPSAFRVLESRLSDERNARLSMQPEREEYAPPIPMEEKRQKYFEFFRTRPPDYEGAEAYLSSLTSTERDYINAKQQGAYARLGGEAAGLMTELFNARQKLRAYWNTQEKALRAKGLWTRWVAANPVQKDKMAQSDAYKEAQRVWGKARENMRKSNPALDRLLVKWYGYTPVR